MLVVLGAPPESLQARPHGTGSRAGRRPPARYRL